MSTRPVELSEGRSVQGYGHAILSNQWQRPGSTCGECKTRQDRCENYRKLAWIEEAERSIGQAVGLTNQIDCISC